MQMVPNVTFHTRVRVETSQGATSFEWKTLTSHDVFAGKTIVVFAVPGAFTPACSSTHLPDYEAAYDAIRAEGVDEVICLSVNDAFVMFQWAKSLGIEKVFMLPDGNGDFTRMMGMLVSRSSTGMGMRSWRYAMVVEDGRIKKLFAEVGICDDPSGVPVEKSSAQNVLNYLREARNA